MNYECPRMEKKCAYSNQTLGLETIVHFRSYVARKQLGSRLPSPGVLLGQQLACLCTFRQKETSSSSESGPLALGGTLYGHLSMLEDCMHSVRSKVTGQSRHVAEHCWPQGADRRVLPTGWLRVMGEGQSSVAQRALWVRIALGSNPSSAAHLPAIGLRQVT